MRFCISPIRANTLSSKTESTHNYGWLPPPQEGKTPPMPDSDPSVLPLKCFPSFQIWEDTHYDHVLYKYFSKMKRQMKWRELNSQQ